MIRALASAMGGPLPIYPQKYECFSHLLLTRGCCSKGYSKHFEPPFIYPSTEIFLWSWRRTLWQNLALCIRTHRASELLNNSTPNLQEEALISFLCIPVQDPERFVFLLRWSQLQRNMSLPPELDLSRSFSCCLSFLCKLPSEGVICPLGMRGLSQVRPWLGLLYPHEIVASFSNPSISYAFSQSGSCSLQLVCLRQTRSIEIILFFIHKLDSKNTC